MLPNRWRYWVGVTLIMLGLSVPAGVLVADHAHAIPRDYTTPDAKPASVLVGVQGPADRGKVAIVEPNDTRIVDTEAASYHAVDRLENGRVLTTYAIEGRTGVRLLAPNGSVTWSWGYSVDTMGNSEVHDAERLPNGDLLVVGMELERVLVVDHPSGTVEWAWNASAYYDAPEDPRAVDWLHMNDVDRIGDGRYLVSVRNKNQLLVLERGRGVVDVINEAGDPTVLRGQHNPHWLGDGRVLVADSGNDRVVELERESGEWRVAWAIDEAGGIPFAWPRDADRLPNGHTLITDSRNHRVVEVDRDGDVVRSWATPQLPYEADLVSVGGEPPAAAVDPYPTMSDRRLPAGDGEDRGMITGKIYLALAHGPGVPFWFRERHVGLLLFGLFTTTGGVATWVADRERLEADATASAISTSSD